MCTVALAWNPGTYAPILCVANRDEFYERPAVPPRIHRLETPLPCIAPQDLQRGGTWIGVNAARVVAALTNRDGAPPGMGRRSRGQLVPCALAHRTPHDAREALRSLDPTTFRPFHLIVANPEEAFLLWSDGTTIHDRTLLPGTHIITQQSIGAAAQDRAVARHLPWLMEYRPLPWNVNTDIGDQEAAFHMMLGFLRSDIARHDPRNPYDGPCVHDDAYGTRSSTIIAAHQNGDIQYHYTDGSPCTARWQMVCRHTHDWWTSAATTPHAIAAPWTIDAYP
ncbi:NRDE family protein [Candidatus Uhrbacteria bacterium]|nr:NRDE family protein [Candidatus Uhrbacteria bacterium]